MKNPVKTTYLPNGVVESSGQMFQIIIASWGLYGSKVADIIGINPSYISICFSSQIKITRRNITKICDKFDVSPDTLQEVLNACSKKLTYKQALKLCLDKLSDASIVERVSSRNEMLRVIRIVQNVEVSELAEILHLDISTVYAIETNPKKYKITKNTIYFYAKWLNVSEETLLGMLEFGKENPTYGEALSKVLHTLSKGE